MVRCDAPDSVSAACLLVKAGLGVSVLLVWCVAELLADPLLTMTSPASVTVLCPLLAVGNLSCAGFLHCQAPVQPVSLANCEQAW